METLECIYSSKSEQHHVVFAIRHSKSSITHWNCDLRKCQMHWIKSWPRTLWEWWDLSYNNSIKCGSITIIYNFVVIFKQKLANNLITFSSFRISRKEYACWHFQLEYSKSSIIGMTRYRKNVLIIEIAIIKSYLQWNDKNTNAGIQGCISKKFQ